MYVPKEIAIIFLICFVMLAIDDIYVTIKLRKIKRKSLAHQMKRAADAVKKLHRSFDQLTEKRGQEIVDNVNKFLKQ